MKILRKVCESQVKEFNEEKLTVTHFISSESPDRGGDILYAGKNKKGQGMIMLGRPVVLQQHGWGQMGMEPIAKPLSIRVAKFKGRNGIEAETQFFADDLGKRLWAKTTQGFMPNWSVGWRPMEGKVEVKQDEEGKEIRHVYEWELLEYSIVGVPMQPDAQTAEAENFYSKSILIPEGEDKAGELVGWRKDDGTWEEKPYPNEHACRLEDPDKYIRIRRQNNKFGKGVHAIWGVQGGGKPVELQAIRFSKGSFTVAEARSWIKEHKYKCRMFEPASEKCDKCGKDMVIKWAVPDVSGDKCGLTCEADFVFEHDGPCEKPQEKVEDAEKEKVEDKTDDEKGKLCTCDGEADKDNVCKLCGKPKPEKAVVSDKEDKQDANQDEEVLPADPDEDEDVGFVMVDADQVRKENQTDSFVHGGHHYIFDFIPEGEIWIDERMTDEDIISLKLGLFVEREMMKYSALAEVQCQEVCNIVRKWITHVVDPEMEGGGHHDDKDSHYYMHDGNHWHNRGQTIRWDSEAERYNVHAILGIELTKEKQEAFNKTREVFEKDMDEAIKSVLIKYGLREGPPPAEPEAEKDKQVNHPEKRTIVILTDEDRRKEESDRKKQVSEMLAPVVVQLNETLKKIPSIVKEELDRMRGKVQ